MNPNVADAAALNDDDAVSAYLTKEQEAEYDAWFARMADEKDAFRWAQIVEDEFDDWRADRIADGETDPTKLTVEAFKDAKIDEAVSAAEARADR